MRPTGFNEYGFFVRLTPITCCRNPECVSPNYYDKNILVCFEYEWKPRVSNSDLAQVQCICYQIERLYRDHL